MSILSVRQIYTCCPNVPTEIPVRLVRPDISLVVEDRREGRWIRGREEEERWSIPMKALRSRADWAARLYTATSRAIVVEMSERPSNDGDEARSIDAVMQMREQRPEDSRLLSACTKRVGGFWPQYEAPPVEARRLEMRCDVAAVQRVPP